MERGTASDSLVSLHGAATAGYPATRAGGAYPYIVVAILMLCSTLSFMDRTLLSLVVDPVKHDLHLSETQIGLLAGFAFAVFYSMVGLPFGSLADRWDRRSLIVIGVAGWSLATLACGFAANFSALFAARAFVGIGEAALAPAAVSLIASYFPPARLGLAMSLLAVGITLGNGAAITLGGEIVHLTRNASLTLPFGLPALGGWRLAFAVVAMLSLPVLLLLAALREPKREAVGAEPTPGLRQIFAHIVEHRGAFAGVFLGYPLVVVMSFAQLIWGASYFLRVHHFTVAGYGAIYGLVMGVGGTAGLLIGGVMSDRMWKAGMLDAPMRVILWSVVLQCPLLIAAYLLRRGDLAMVFFSVAIVVLCANGGLQNATLRILTPERMRGRMVAMYVIVANLIGGGLAPWLTALMTERVFGGPAGIGRSLATLAVISLCPAAVILALSLKFVRQSAARLNPPRSVGFL